MPDFGFMISSWFNKKAYESREKNDVKDVEKNGDKYANFDKKTSSVQTSLFENMGKEDFAKTMLEYAYDKKANKENSLFSQGVTKSGLLDTFSVLDEDKDSKLSEAEIKKYSGNDGDDAGLSLEDLKGVFEGLGLNLTKNKQDVKASEDYSPSIKTPKNSAVTESDAALQKKIDEKKTEKENVYNDLNEEIAKQEELIRIARGNNDEQTKEADKGINEQFKENVAKIEEKKEFIQEKTAQMAKLDKNSTYATVDEKNLDTKWNEINLIQSAHKEKRDTLKPIKEEVDNKAQEAKNYQEQKKEIEKEIKAARDEIKNLEKTNKDLEKTKSINQKGGDWWTYGIWNRDKGKEIENAEKNIQTAKDEASKKVAEIDKQMLLLQVKKADGGAVETQGQQIKEQGMTFDDMLAEVLGVEGGFSDHPNDKGGKTNYGITENVYKRHYGKNANVKDITLDQAREIYYKDYYLASGADVIKEKDPNLAYLVFDSAVNHGDSVAQKFLKESNGDLDKYMELRKDYYKAIVKNNPKQKDFEEGWQNRWNKVYSTIDPEHKYVDYTGQRPELEGQLVSYLIEKDLF